MVRRVKAYLSRLQVITDEEQLRNMSLECEAGPEGHKPAGGHSNSSSSGSSSAPPTNPPPRRRPHSPTPSTTSSTSSTSQTSDGKKHTAKFGKWLVSHSFPCFLYFFSLCSFSFYFINLSLLIH